MMGSQLKIVQLCWSDIAGVVSRLWESIDAYTPHYIRYFCSYENDFGYPTDVIFGKDPHGQEKFLKALESCHIVHIHDNHRHLMEWVTDRDIENKTIIYHHHGTRFRRNHEEFKKWAEDRGGIQLTSTFELLRYGKELRWLPSPVDLKSLPLKKHCDKKVLTIAYGESHTGENKTTRQVRKAKGLDRLQEALKKFKGKYQLKVYSDLKHKEFIEKMSKADVIMDTLADHGYGVGGIEAMGMGIPTLAQADEFTNHKIKEIVGSLPYIDTREHGLENALEMLLDKKERELWGEAGRKHVERFHDFPKVAQRAIRIYRGVDEVKTKPTILMVQWSPCIRNFKEAQALKEKGYKLHLLGSKFIHKPPWDEAFETISLFSGQQDLPAALSFLVDRADIIHVHNEPNWVTRKCIANGKGKPVIHDNHDMTSLRFNIKDNPRFAPNLKDEKVCMAQSDGIITVSEDLVGVVEKEKCPYNLPVLNLESRHNRSSIQPKVKKPKHPPWRIVYEGGLVDEPMGSTYACRNHWGAFSQMINDGATVDAYAVYPHHNVSARAKETRVNLHSFHPLEQLLKKMTAFHWGYCGCPPEVKDNRHISTAFANKVWDYLAVGLPIISLNYRTMAKFIKRHKIGIVVDKYEEIIPALNKANYKALLKNVYKKREEFSMEATIHRLEDFYKIFYGGGYG